MTRLLENILDLKRSPVFSDERINFYLTPIIETGLSNGTKTKLGNYRGSINNNLDHPFPFPIKYAGDLVFGSEAGLETWVKGISRKRIREIRNFLYESREGGPYWIGMEGREDWRRIRESQA